MNQVEQKIQIEAMVLIERLFRKEYKDYLVLLEDSNKNIIPWSCMFHTPNGGYRPGKAGMTFKQMGVKSGVPDLILPIPNKNHPGLWIEIKRPKGGSLANNQKQWKSLAHQLNIQYHELRDPKEILRVVESYMDDIL